MNIIIGAIFFLAVIIAFVSGWFVGTKMTANIAKKYMVKRDEHT